MVTTVQAGVRVITPDFWVVRVSLLGLDERGLIKLMNALKRRTHRRRWKSTWRLVRRCAVLASLPVGTCREK